MNHFIIVTLSLESVTLTLAIRIIYRIKLKNKRLQQSKEYKPKPEQPKRKEKKTHQASPYKYNNIICNYINVEDIPSESPFPHEPVYGQIPSEVIYVTYTIYRPYRKKTCLWGYVNKKGADQPAHPDSLISAFVILLFASTVSSLITNEISLFLLVAVAEETGLSLALSKTPKTSFVTSMHIYDYSSHAFKAPRLICSMLVGKVKPVLSDHTK